MKKTFLPVFGIFFVALSLVACSSGEDSNDNNNDNCETLASDVDVDPASDACTTSAGKWTQWTVDVVAKTAFKQCDINEADLYADQAAFDDAEGTSSVPDITITSNDDYVITDTCASGSIEYSNPPTDTTFLFIWEKQE